MVSATAEQEAEDDRLTAEEEAEAVLLAEEKAEVDTLGQWAASVSSVASHLVGVGVAAVAVTATAAGTVGAALAVAVALIISGATPASDLDVSGIASASASDVVPDDWPTAAASAATVGACAVVVPPTGPGVRGADPVPVLDTSGPVVPVDRTGLETSWPVAPKCHPG